MHKRKYLKSISARLNKKRTMSKNPFNRPPPVNITSKNIDKPRQSGKNIDTPYIDYHKGRISKGKGKWNEKDNKEYNQFNP